MEEAKQICMETSLRAEQTLATATALVHVDMRAWETSERVQQQRRKVLPSPQHIHIKALQPGACLTQNASPAQPQCGRCARLARRKATRMKTCASELR